MSHDPGALLLATSPPAIIQSVHAAALREINSLERRIVASEDDADEALWEQARQVVAQLEAGLSQRALAALWISVRTGEAYSVMHVNYVKQVWLVKSTLQPRPRFRDAYNEIANASKPYISQATGQNEWYTPAAYLDAARAVMGGIDCDPASSAEANQLVRATTYYTAEQDGLTRPWQGRVWLNPPYALALITQFCNKLAESVETGAVSEAIVLTNNATETIWGQGLLALAAAVCFLKGRIRFINAAGEQPAGAPLQGQMLTYVGRDVEKFRDETRALGSVWCRHA